MPDMNEQSFSKPTRLRLIATIAIVSLVSSIISVILSSLFFNHRDISQSSSAQLTEATNNSVAALGRLSPQGEVIHLSAPAFMEGARVEKLLVKLGDRVEAGQVIAILDSRDRLEAALKYSQKQVKIAQATLMQVKAGAKIGTMNAQTAAIGRLQAELIGQIGTQTATIERLQTEWYNAQTECQRYQNLYQNGAISASEHDNKCLIPKTIQKQIQEAKVNLNRTRRTLNQQLTEAKATYDQIAEVRPTDVAVAQAQLEAAQANVAQALANFNLAFVRSPQSGQILKIHTFPGEMINNQGIVELGQTNQMYAIAEVYETDISQIHIGQKATITSKGLTNKLQGIVDEIGLQIGKKDVLNTDPAADVDARVIEVKIRLHPEDSLKVIGLTNLKVNIVIDTYNSHQSGS